MILWFYSSRILWFYDKLAVQGLPWTWKSIFTEEQTSILWLKVGAEVFLLVPRSPVAMIFLPCIHSYHIYLIHSLPFVLCSCLKAPCTLQILPSNPVVQSGSVSSPVFLAEPPSLPSHTCMGPVGHKARLPKPFQAHWMQSRGKLRHSQSLPSHPHQLYRHGEEGLSDAGHGPKRSQINCPELKVSWNCSWLRAGHQQGISKGWGRDQVTVLWLLHFEQSSWLAWKQGGSLLLLLTSAVSPKKLNSVRSPGGFAALSFKSGA